MRTAADVLEELPGFAGAKVISQLSDGPTNASFEVGQGGDRYVLRIDKPSAAAFGLDRSSELEVIRELVTAGMVESPAYYDAASGIYLRSFIPGSSWTEEDLESPVNLERLARLLSQVHQLPPVGRRFDPLGSARRYVEQLGTARALDIYRDIEVLFASPEPFQPTLCHNDLVHTNILESDELMLIDWEWAGIGDSYFDLAIVVQHHGLGEELGRHFLATYLGREPSKEETVRLQRQCRFYQLLLQLWNQL